jgi:hypothetical protein
MTRAATQAEQFDRERDCRKHEPRPTHPSIVQRENDTRRHLADFIAEVLRAAPCCQPSEGWTPAVVTESVTTSGCPLITLAFPHDGAFNVTITRARP